MGTKDHLCAKWMYGIVFSLFQRYRNEKEARPIKEQESTVRNQKDHQEELKIHFPCITHLYS